MGQRSQIYVRYTTDNGKHFLTARYHQWNYGERMISRCRSIMEWIEENKCFAFYLTTDTAKLKRIIDVNFDYHDVVIGDDIVDEYYEYCNNNDDFAEWVFKRQDNNDGKLFIDVTNTGIKYAFLNTECQTDDIMDAKAYLKWDFPDFDTYLDIDDEIKTMTYENIERINEMAELMTETELNDFISCKFENENRSV